MVKTLLRACLTLALLSALVYGLIVLAAWTGQRTLLFRPDANPLPAAPAGGETLRLPASDGTLLRVWWWPPPNDQAQVVLYLSGSAGSLRDRSARLAQLHEAGLGVMALSWRGYGGSGGEPTEAGWRLDARAAWEALLQLRVAPARVVLFGEGLGSAQAVMLGAEVPAAALVLESSFNSARSVMQRHYPWLPVTALMRDPHRADLAARKVQSPVLQVHCEQDPAVPLSHAQRLQKAFAQESQLQVLPNCQQPALDQYMEVLMAFLQRLPAPLP